MNPEMSKIKEHEQACSSENGISNSSHFNKKHLKRSHQTLIEASNNKLYNSSTDESSAPSKDSEDINAQEIPRKSPKFKGSNLQLILSGNHNSKAPSLLRNESTLQNQDKHQSGSLEPSLGALQIARSPKTNAISPTSSLLTPLSTLQNSEKKYSDGLVPYHDWKVILRSRDSNQVVLYNRQNHELAVTSGRNQSKSSVQGDALVCHFCHQPLPQEFSDSTSDSDTKSHNTVFVDSDTAEIGLKQNYPNHHSTPEDDSCLNFMDRNYFRCLALSHSQLSKQRLLVDNSTKKFEETTLPERDANFLSQDSFNQGYYKKFFKEAKKLGKGAKGNVFLCQHVLEDIELGRYAVKKVAIGNNHTWLARMLKEVHMLERLRHPNIIDYKHAWLENHQPNLFAPVVPCLFILMECANGGNLEEYVNRRSSQVSPDSPDFERMTPKDRALFLRQQNARKKGLGKHGSLNDKAENKYLSLREILSLFLDICHGLSHLHRYSIVHRDIKPPNLLLSFKNVNDANEIPTVLISDFGECEDASKLSHPIGRTGATGTLEFMAPELLQMDTSGRFFGEHSPKADMWSLGMVLYYMCYSKLPYAQIDDLDFLRDEILCFQGPIKFPDDSQASPRIPSQFKRLISLLLSRDPHLRPSVDEILANARDVDFQLLVPGHYYPNSLDSLDKRPVDSLKESRALVSRNDTILNRSNSPLKMQATSLADNSKTPTNSSATQSPFPKVDSPLVQTHTIRQTNHNLHLNVVLIGLKMGSILIPCYPTSAHLAASLPLTALAIWGLYSNDSNTQWCLLAIHASFLLFLLFSLGSICGA